MTRTARILLFLTLLLVPATTQAQHASRAKKRAPAPMTRRKLKAIIDSLVTQRMFANAHWGVLIVNPAKHDTLYSRNAGKLFLPASNMKIVTGAVALTQLGANYQWRTSFVARGAVHDSTLDGDLLVVGRGDPTVSDHMRGDAMAPLRDVADSLAAHGIRHITGRVLPWGDAFPGDPHGFGWSFDELAESYASGVDELELNEAFIRLTIVGTRPGSPPIVRAHPVTTVPIRVEAVTVAPTAGAAAEPTLEIATDSSYDRYVLRGTIPAGDSTTVDVADPDPDGGYIVGLNAALAERGVRVDGRSVASNAALDTLFTTLSPPLSLVMPAMMKTSDNQIAEALFKTIALERHGTGSADSAMADVTAQLRAWGVDSAGIVVRDGSGLSRYDYVTPTTIVRVLATMMSRPDFNVYYDAFPIAGVDGTIEHRMRDTPAAGNAHAKTGFVSQARSLSGYVTTADGETLLFSLLCNNWTAPRASVEGVQDAIVERLASLHSRSLR